MRVLVPDGGTASHRTSSTTCEGSRFTRTCESVGGAKNGDDLGYKYAEQSESAQTNALIGRALSGLSLTGE